VIRTGVVPDVRAFVAGAAVSVVPIRGGSGTRLKVLESFALRTPVVATTKAVEGLNVRHGEHLLIADDPRDFAHAVLSLMREPEQAETLVSNAFALVKAEYDWKRIVPRFTQLVQQAACA
jgi:glycosyltransferase involved in cell wall biosynthesis